MVIRDATGRCLLHYAAFNLTIPDQSLDILLQQDKFHQFPDFNGYTPLQIAEHCNNTRVLARLQAKRESEGAGKRKNTQEVKVGLDVGGSEAFPMKPEPCPSQFREVIDKPLIMGLLDPNEKLVVVYGFEHCYYQQIQRYLTDRGIRAWDYEIGWETSRFLNDCQYFGVTPVWCGWCRREECRECMLKMCKAGLVHLVLDNFRRQLQAEPITSLLFCIQTDQSARPTAESIFSKEKGFNDRATHKELRRMAKLCHDQRVPEDIREVAKKTLKCVWVKGDPSANHFILEVIEPPFNQEIFDRLHEERRESKRTGTSVASPHSTGKIEDWRDRLEDRYQKLRRALGGRESTKSEN